MGARAQRLPPRCIADDHAGGLCFEPVVVVVVAVVVVLVLVLAGHDHRVMFNVTNMYAGHKQSVSTSQTD